MTHFMPLIVTLLIAICALGGPWVAWAIRERAAKQSGNKIIQLHSGDAQWWLAGCPSKIGTMVVLNRPDGTKARYRLIAVGKQGKIKNGDPKLDDRKWFTFELVKGLT